MQVRTRGRKQAWTLTVAVTKHRDQKPPPDSFHSAEQNFGFAGVVRVT
jgi:hypothetical protein